MIATLKAELRKIYNIRSTYAILLFSLVLMLIFAFWVEGIKAGENGRAVTDSGKLAGLLLDAITNLAFWGAIVGILSVTHEYRYNTIVYTLTASRSRSRVLLSKIIAVSLFAVFFSIFVSVFAVALMYLGLAIKGVSLSHQVLPLDLIWRILFVGWGYSMGGLLLASLIRQQVGSIVAFFVLPNLVEALVGLLLKDNKMYLPFTSLQQVTKVQNTELRHTLSHGRAALVFGVYLIVGWIVAWYLFLRRDATT
ncbi:MAG TPA: ABC transporter permease [Candidatus Saccharimonadales bacterium]|nr:ABC transporter permease [Candidatus Saccharimonadales bacterium]